MGALGRWRWRLTLALALLIVEAIFWAVAALAGYALRGLNLNGTRTGDYVSQDILAAEIMAVWAVAHLLVAAAAVLSRGAAWRVTAGTVQLVDFAVLAYAEINTAPREAGELLISLAANLVPLAGAAIVLGLLRAPPVTGPGSR